VEGELGYINDVERKGRRSKRGYLLEDCNGLDSSDLPAIGESDGVGRAGGDGKGIIIPLGIDDAGGEEGGEVTTADPADEAADEKLEDEKTEADRREHIGDTHAAEVHEDAAEKDTDVGEDGAGAVDDKTEAEEAVMDDLHDAPRDGLGLALDEGAEVGIDAAEEEGVREIEEGVAGPVGHGWVNEDEEVVEDEGDGKGKGSNVEDG
jgi:hypothetical protein